MSATDDIELGPKDPTSAPKEGGFLARCLPKPVEGEARKLTPLEKFILFAQFCATVVSLILAILSYTSWSTNQEVLNDFANNWTQLPFDDVRPSTLSVCPTGYSFWGPTGSQDYRVEVVDSEGKKKSESRQEFISLWKGARLCVRRQPQYGNALTRVRAIYNSSSGLFECNTPGTRLCGIDDCIETTLSCPLTGFTLSSGAGDADHTFSFNGLTWHISPQTQTNANALINLAVNTQNPTGKDLCLGMTPGSVFSNFCSYGDGRYRIADSYSHAANGQRQLFIDNSFTAAGLASAVDGYGAYLFTRPEITWSHTCPESRRNAYDNTKPLDTIVTTQLLVLIVSIVACVGNLYLSYQVYQERTDDNEHNDDESARKQFYLGVITDALILIMTIIALAIAETCRAFLDSMSDRNCSDAITSGMFHFFAKEITKVNALNIALLVVRGVWLLFRVGKCLFKPQSIGK